MLYIFCWLQRRRFFFAIICVLKKTGFANIFLAGDVRIILCGCVFLSPRTYCHITYLISANKMSRKTILAKMWILIGRWVCPSVVIKVHVFQIRRFHAVFTCKLLNEMEKGGKKWFEKIRFHCMKHIIYPAKIYHSP